MPEQRLGRSSGGLNRRSANLSVSVKNTPGSHIRIQLKVVLGQLSTQLDLQVHQLRQLLGALGADPRQRGLNERKEQLASLLDQLLKLSVLGLSASILLRGHNVLGSVVVKPAQVLGNVLLVGKLGQVVGSLGEVHLGRNHRVQPALDDLPHGIEDPGRLVDPDGAQGLRVVGLKRLGQELDGSQVGVLQRKVLHVKQNVGAVVSKLVVLERNSHPLNDQTDEPLKVLLGTVQPKVLLDANHHNGPVVLVHAPEVRLLHLKRLDDLRVLLALVDLQVAVHHPLVHGVLLDFLLETLGRHVDDLVCFELSGSDKPEERVVWRVVSERREKRLVQLGRLEFGQMRVHFLGGSLGLDVVGSFPEVCFALVGVEGLLGAFGELGGVSEGRGGRHFGEGVFGLAGNEVFAAFDVVVREVVEVVAKQLEVRGPNLLEHDFVLAFDRPHSVWFAGHFFFLLYF